MMPNAAAFLSATAHSNDDLGNETAMTPRSLSPELWLPALSSASYRHRLNYCSPGSLLKYTVYTEVLLPPFNHSFTFLKSPWSLLNETSTSTDPYGSLPVTFLNPEK